MRTRHLLVAAATLTLLSACGTASPAPAAKDGDQPRRITLIQGVQGDEFYISMACGAAERARAGGADVTVTAPDKWDATLQTPIVDAVTANHPDAVLVAPTDTKAMIEPLRRMQAAGIKVIQVDTRVDDEAVAYSHIASDNTEGGRLAARALLDLTGAKGSYLVINVKPGISTTDQRQRGFEQEIRRAKGITYLGTRFSDDEPAKAGAIVTETLAAHPDLTGIFATNLFAAEGAAIALRSAAAQDRVKIVGFDAGPNQVRDLRDDVVQALVVQKPYDIGVRGVEQALAAIDGRPTTKAIATGFVVATKENLDDPAVSKYLYKGRC